MPLLTVFFSLNLSCYQCYFFICSIWNTILFLSLLPAFVNYFSFSFSISFLDLVWKFYPLFLFFQWLFKLVLILLCSSWVIINRCDATFSVYCYKFPFYGNSLLPAGADFGPRSILCYVIMAKPFQDSHLSNG